MAVFFKFLLKSVCLCIGCMCIRLPEPLHMCVHGLFFVNDVHLKYL